MESKPWVIFVNLLWAKTNSVICVNCEKSLEISVRELKLRSSRDKTGSCCSLFVWTSFSTFDFILKKVKLITLCQSKIDVWQIEEKFLEMIQIYTFINGVGWRWGLLVLTLAHSLMSHHVTLNSVVPLHEFWMFFVLGESGGTLSEINDAPRFHIANWTSITAEKLGIPLFGQKFLNLTKYCLFTYESFHLFYHWK